MVADEAGSADQAQAGGHPAWYREHKRGEARQAGRRPLNWWLGSVAFVGLVMLGTAFAQDPSLPPEQRSCPPVGVSGDKSDPVGYLQKQIYDALPCAFTSTAYEPAGSGNLVMYLAPLDAHTRSVAKAVIDASPLRGGVKLKNAKQSYSRADEQISALLGRFGDRVGPVWMNVDGTVSVTVVNDDPSDYDIIAASHVPGYQADPIIDHESHRIVIHG